MIYCRECGVMLDEDSNFCDCCGAAINIVNIPNRPVMETQSNTKYDVEENLDDYESPLHEFIRRLDDIETKKVETRIRERRRGNYRIRIALDQQKINLIKNFVIPNTIEDISEFIMITAEHKTDVPERDLTKQEMQVFNEVKNTWNNKFELAVDKAEQIFGDTSEYEELRRKYFPRRRSKRGKRIVNKIIDVFD